MIWQADKTKPSYGFAAEQGAEGAIELTEIAGRAALRYVVSDTDTGAEGLNAPVLGGPFNVNRSNPAADLIAGPPAHEGDRRSYKFGVYIPASQPDQPGGTFPPVDATLGAWLEVMELYGPPFAGPPPVGLAISKLGGINQWFCVGAPLIHRTHPWMLPVTYDTWTDFQFDVAVSADPTKGSLAIAVNGRPQKFANGATVLHYPTINHATASGALWLHCQQYRKKGAFPGRLETVFGADVEIS